MSNLEKRKPSSISLYLFHLYSRNECLKEEEMDELEIAKKYVQLGITPETVAHPEIIEIESERNLPSSKEQIWMAGTSSSGRMKQTYKSPEGRLPIQSVDWKSKVASEGDPFQRVFEELDQVHF